MRVLTTIVLLFTSILLWSQELHIGTKAGIAKTSLQAKELVFHWSSIENVSDYVRGLKDQTLFISPSFLSATFETKSGLNIYTNISNYSYSFRYDLVMKPDEYFYEYLNVGQENGELIANNPFELQINTNYFSADWGLGYTFFKNKLVRPMIFAGMNHLVLLSISERNPAANPDFYYSSSQSFAGAFGRQRRNNIIYNSLNRFNQSVNFLRVGVGIKVYNFSLSLMAEQNINQIDDTEIYSNFRNFYLNVGVDLLSFNLGKKSKLNDE